MKKIGILSILISALLISGCNSGGDASGNSNGGSTYNPQPSELNATNYFSTYMQNSPSNNTVIQVQFSNNNKTLATNLLFFNLFTYSPNSTVGQAIASYSLVATSQTNNYTIQNGSSSIGNIQIKQNNIIMNLNNLGISGEKSVILIGAKNQSLIQPSNYIGFCYNLPNLINNTNSNNGQDVCQYSINSDNSMTITNLSVNQTGVQQQLCSGNWSQNQQNPYFYNLNCGNTNITTTFESYNGYYLMNPYISPNMAGNTNVAYVGSFFQNQNLDQFESNSIGQAVIQLNNQNSGNISQSNSLITKVSVTNELCASDGDSIGTCPLSSLTTSGSIVIPNGVKVYQTPTATTIFPAIIGNSNIGLFTDNNLMSYYFN